MTNYKSLLVLLMLSLTAAGIIVFAQKNTTMKKITHQLPYQQIPDAPAEYTNVNVVARMIDGLGYRYYWATEGLRAEDLAFKPSDDARTAAQTLEHLHSLSETILNATNATPNIRPRPARPDTTYSFEDERRWTLENLKQASENLRNSSPDAMEDMKIIFKRGEKQSEFPFWNMLNGPIADAIYHTGQIVSFRRSSGNPLNPNVNVFIGKNRQ